MRHPEHIYRKKVVHNARKLTCSFIYGYNLQQLQYFQHFMPKVQIKRILLYIRK